MSDYHIPVMREEVLTLIQDSSIVSLFDCTMGAGGYAKEILNEYSPLKAYFGLDQDIEALQEVERTIQHPKLRLLHSNFSEIKQIILTEKPEKPLGFLFDLGVSSHQIDDSSRGFSYRFEGPLDMRMNQKSPTTAADLIKTSTEKQLADLIYLYGEEPASRKIAKEIIEIRRKKPIQTTNDLANIIHTVIKGNYERKQMAIKRVFQAFRIAVNNEMLVLEQGLSACLECIKQGGCIIVLTYHSLEDRCCKQLFQRFAASFDDKNTIEYSKKPMIPSPQELSINKRSASAKLRFVKVRS